MIERVRGEPDEEGSRETAGCQESDDRDSEQLEHSRRAPACQMRPEDALRTSSQRFYSRFARMEQAARAGGKDLAQLEPDEMNRLWEGAKSG